MSVYLQMSKKNRTFAVQKFVQQPTITITNNI